MFPSNQKSENTFLNVWSRISPRTGHTYQQDYVWSQVMNFYLTIMILPVILSFTKASVAFTISFAQKSSNVAGSLWINSGNHAGSAIAILLIFLRMMVAKIFLYALQFIKSTFII